MNYHVLGATETKALFERKERKMKPFKKRIHQ